MIEEKVIQSDSVNPAEQPVAETASQPTHPQAPDLTAVKTQYEEKIAALTSLFDQQVIDREEFRDILVQGEVLPSANQTESS